LILSTKLLAKFAVNLLNHPFGSVINIGRKNVRRDDFNSLQIIIDSVGTEEILGKSNSYDSVNEIMHYYQKMRADMTIDFYGDDANSESTNFMLLLESQKAHDLSRDLGFTLNYTTSITDVKLLTGEQFSNRLQIALTIEYVNSTELSALRIDELQTEFLENY